MRGVAMPLSLFVTFMVVGIWHGTDPGFAVFGALHGLGVLAVAPYTALLKPLLGPDGLEAYEANPWLCPLRVAGCYTYLCFTMVFFERPLAEIVQVLL